MPYVATLNPNVEFASRQAGVLRDATETEGYPAVNLRASYVLVHEPG